MYCYAISSMWARTRPEKSIRFAVSCWRLGDIKHVLNCIPYELGKAAACTKDLPHCTPYKPRATTTALPNTSHTRTAAATTAIPLFGKQAFGFCVTCPTTLTSSRSYRTSIESFFGPVTPSALIFSTLSPLSTTRTPAHCLAATSPQQSDGHLHRLKSTPRVARPQLHSSSDRVAKAAANYRFHDSCVKLSWTSRDCYRSVLSTF